MSNNFLLANLTYTSDSEATIHAFIEEIQSSGDIKQALSNLISEQMNCLSGCFESSELRWFFKDHSGAEYKLNVNLVGDHFCVTEMPLNFSELPVFTSVPQVGATVRHPSF